MNYCVRDTERIKGNLIYLFSYQLHDKKFELIESKTYQDISINVSNRKSPKNKVKLLDSISIKVSLFRELYNNNVKGVMNNSYLIVFSDTDLNIMKKNCKEQSIHYKRVKTVDLQEILYGLSTD